MRRNEGVRIAEDERAYVPFAVIGVFLLLTSVAVVAALETRSEPEVDTSASQAYDRTSSAAQTTLQEAAAAALQDAAARPVTDPDTSTPVGDALDDPGEEPFTRYVKLRAYLEARERVPRAGQELPGGTVTNVSMREFSDPEAAVDAVTIQVGGDDLDYGAPYSDDLPRGAVRITFPEVEIEVERDDATVARRSQQYTVTVGSAAFALHNRTERYEEALNTDRADDDGFANHLASRLSRVGWHRAYAQSEGEPVAQVLGDRHLETLANDARYATQRDVFGAEDPYADRKLTRAYACTLADDHHGVYDDPTGGSADLGAVLPDVDGTDFCGAVNATYDGVSGSLEGAEAPEYTELVDDHRYLEETETIDLADQAETTFGRFGTEGGVDAAIDRTYTVGAYVEDDLDRIRATDPYHPGGAEVRDARQVGMTDATAWVEEMERVVDSEDTDLDRAYYRFYVVFVGDYEFEVDWSNGDTTTEYLRVRFSGNLTVAGNHSVASTVDQRGVDHDYRPDAEVVPDVPVGTNHVDTPERAVEAVLAGVDDASQADRQLEQHLQDNAHRIYDRADLVDVATAGDGEAELVAEPYDRERLRGWIVEELRETEREAAGVSTTASRHELLARDSPLTDLESGIQDDDRYVYDEVDGPHYANLPDRARAEARLAYVERLRADLADAIRSHHRTLDALDDTLRAHDAGSLAETTAFTRDQVHDSPYEPTPPSDRFELVRDVETVPDGAPTYHTFERISADQEPAVGTPPHGFAPAAAQRRSPRSVPYEGTTAARLETAGGVLRAARAVQSQRGGSWADAEVGALESHLDAEIDRVTDDAARNAARALPHARQRSLESAIDDEVRRLGPVETQATALTRPRTVERVASNVSDAFTYPGPDADYDYDPADHDAHVERAVRYGLVAAMGDGSVRRGSLDAATRDVDRRVRTAVDGSLDDVVDERRRQAASAGLGTTATTPRADGWLASDPGTGDHAPGSVPAGTPLVDGQTWDLATVNVWNVRVVGQYERFALRSTVDRAGDATTTYVRTDERVTVSFDGTEHVAGDVEPVGYESNVSVVVGVPPDGLGVGDRTREADWCTETYDEVGPIRRLGALDPCAGASP